MPTKAELEREIASLRQLLAGHRWRGHTAPTLELLRARVDGNTGPWACPGCMTDHPGPTRLLAHIRKCAECK